jgi:hypothetical protein
MVSAESSAQRHRAAFAAADILLILNIGFVVSNGISLAPRAVREAAMADELKRKRNENEEMGRSDEEVRDRLEGEDEEFEDIDEDESEDEEDVDEDAS